ncbi:putative carboxylesterase [Helianthus annuus]|nr:putative carboxylesterase [Helianthus annuus]KAJ0748222.1 putative carboxylesterase [Helianthus annuus]
MEVERESVKLLLDDELIKAACNLSMKAHNHNQDYLTNTKKHNASSSSSTQVLIIALKGSFEVDDFYHDDHFGETNVDCSLFPSLRRIGEAQLAKVNGPILKIFQDILNNSGFISEVEKAVKEDKKILFTGHSSGGAKASLATLWMLDEYTRKRKIRHPIGCVTFGSPLIGDQTVSHAVRREKWAGHFTHFVMEHDIVPRMMLAPKTSIQEHLSDILQFFQQKVKPITTQKPHKFPKFLNKKIPVRTIDHDQLVDDNQAVTFFEYVLINASTVANHDAFDLMEPTNSLKDKLSADFAKVSPYRPFGTYVFCTRGDDLGASSPRQQLVVENPNAVLQLLFYFLQLPNEDQNLPQFAHESLNDNFVYEEELNNNGLQLVKMVDLKHLNDHLLTSDGTTGDIVRTSNKALFELTASAKWCLLAVEEGEKRKLKNMDQIKKSMRKYKSNESESTTKIKIVEDMLDEMHKYKEKARHGTTDYYEAFKLQDEYVDFEANVSRLEQAKIWDVIVEMVVRKDLPDEFEASDEVGKLATEFRRLYEPLDIANYYRHSKGDDNKGLSYMEVRPKRYKFTQRWYEHANAMEFELLSESNFVAEVEELMKPRKKTVEEARKDFENIKDKVRMWKSDEKIVYEDVFCGESVLSRLQEKLAEA